MLPGALSRGTQTIPGAQWLSDGISCVVPMTILIGLMAALGIGESRGIHSRQAGEREMSHRSP